MPGSIRDPNDHTYLATWKPLVYAYMKNKNIYECPNSRAGLARLYDPTSTWGGYWSLMDFAWVDCSPDSKTYTGNPLCIYSQGNFFLRGYTLNGQPFGVGFLVGAGTYDGDCGECNGSTITLAGVPQAADTALVMDTRDPEPVSSGGSMARCWREMGASGEGNKNRVPDPTSPSGFRRTVSWYTQHSKGTQWTLADGHSKWMRVVGSYAVNWMKFDCIRNANDEKTWPTGGYSPANCGGIATAAECMALAQRLVSSEDL